MMNITRITRIWALPVVIVWWMVVGSMGAAAVSPPTLVSVSTDSSQRYTAKGHIASSAPPTLVSVSTDSSQSIIATWTLPEAVYFQYLTWNTDGSLSSRWPAPGQGTPLDCDYDQPSTDCTGYIDVTSPTSTTATISGLDPGTYYVQLRTRVVLWPDGVYSAVRWSNVLSVVVLPRVVVSPPPDPSTTATVAIVGRLIVNGTPATGSVLLRAGDKITAGTDGDGFSFSDGSKVVLKKGTTFIFTGPNTGRLSLGSIWLSLKKRKFQVTTTNAIAGVRGTILTVEVTKTFTRLRTYQGAVTFKNVKGKTKRTVTVKKGFESIVRLTKPPTKPHKFKKPTKPFWA